MSNLPVEIDPAPTDGQPAFPVPSGATILLSSTGAPDLISGDVRWSTMTLYGGVPLIAGAPLTLAR